MSDLEQFSKIFSLSVFIICLIDTIVVALVGDNIERYFKSRKRKN